MRNSMQSRISARAVRRHVVIAEAPSLVEDDTGTLLARDLEDPTGDMMARDRLVFACSVAKMEGCRPSDAQGKVASARPAHAFVQHLQQVSHLVVGQPRPKQRTPPRRSGDKPDAVHDADNLIAVLRGHGNHLSRLPSPVVRVK